MRHRLRDGRSASPSRSRANEASNVDSGCLSRLNTRSLLIAKGPHPEPLLAKVDTWCAKQKDVSVRLVRGKPMTDAQIDRIPKLPLTFWGKLPTPYDPARFVVLP
jgi:hypothetical protein